MPSENLSMRVKDDFDRILKEEIIETQDLLINVMLDVLNGVLKKTIGETVNTNEIMQQFLESFTTKKIKNYQLLEKQTAEIRIISKKWSDKFDNTETTFEKFMKILEGVETSFIQKVENEERQSEALKHYEQVCDQKDHLLDSNNQALQEELEILRNQNMQNTRKNSQSQDFNANTTDLEYQNYDSFSKCFIDSFSHKVKQYSGKIDFGNRDQLLIWLKNLILKMENDNKWLLDQINHSENSMVDVRAAEIEYKNMWQASELRTKDIVRDMKKAIDYSLGNKMQLDKLKKELRYTLETNMKTDGVINAY
jgi:hypothetical protein